SLDPDMLVILEKAFNAHSPPVQGHRPPRHVLRPANLTPRERLVLAEILMGLSSKEVARSLEISPRTVEFHRANLLKKYGAKNTAELVRKVLG
ncbi:MAG: LuxR C-terminal-related transcriptional regulator, partial [Isosphaeraceae bacterium]